jgi:uncharacterized membrane protein required for colicin V production
MNILTIIILAVFALCVFSGYKKGFLKTAFSLVSWIVVLVLCDFATPIVTDLLVENTDVEVVVEQTVDAKMLEAIEQAVQNSDVSELEAALPAGIKDLLLGEHESISEALANTDALDLSPVVDGIVGIIGFVVTLIILRITMVVVEFVLGVVSKLPLIGPMDKLLGIGCGAGKGLIWCWVILAVVSVLALTGTNTEFAAYISQSELLTWLQDNNLLLNLIVNLK